MGQIWRAAGLRNRHPEKDSPRQPETARDDRRVLLILRSQVRSLHGPWPRSRLLADISALLLAPVLDRREAWEERRYLRLRPQPRSIQQDPTFRPTSTIRPSTVGGRSGWRPRSCAAAAQGPVRRRCQRPAQEARRRSFHWRRPHHALKRAAAQQLRPCRRRRGNRWARRPGRRPGSVGSKECPCPPGRRRGRPPRCHRSRGGRWPRRSGQEIVGGDINRGAEGVEAGVPRGLRVDGAYDTADFGPSARGPCSTARSVESIV